MCYLFKFVFLCCFIFLFSNTANLLRTSEKGLGSWFGRGARESGRPCGVTSDNGPAVNDHAVTSRNCVLDPRKNETLDVTSKPKNENFFLGIFGGLRFVLCH